MSAEKQRELFDFDAATPEEATRAMLDQLLTDARLYRTSESFKELLAFVVRLRNFAPFNAMLLQIQKPGLTYAASAHDWATRFGRRVKEDARPLVILWPFGPVALVYDVQDTEGQPLPQDVAAFFASGDIKQLAMTNFRNRLASKHIDWEWMDAGDAKAGNIRVVVPGDGKDRPTYYQLKINRNHDVAVQFATLAHELAHLFLGHLGADTNLKIPHRADTSHVIAEVEAESVAYLVCARNGIQSKSENYLSEFVTQETNVASLPLYQIMRAAGHIETILGLTAHTAFRPSGEAFHAT